MDELTENSKDNKSYLLYIFLACFILFVVYMVVVSPHLAREKFKTEILNEISNANTYNEIGIIVQKMDFKDQFVIDEIKKKNDHKELLLQYILSSCSNGEKYSNLCQDRERINQITSTFHIDLPNNDKLLAAFFKDNDKDSLSFTKIFEYETIVNQYKNLFKNNFEYSSGTEGNELLSRLKLELKKHGLYMAEFEGFKDKLEKTCNNPPSNYLLKPFCDEPSSTWEEALITGFRNEVYDRVKNEGASERANSLRKLYEQVDEFKNSNYGKSFKAKLTEVQNLAQSKMPTDYDVQKDNVREAIHMQAEAIKLQGMIQQQQEQQRNQKNQN